MDRLQTLMAELVSGNDEHADLAARKLAFQGPDAIPLLLELLASPDPERRWWAVRTLAEITEPQVLQLLLNALHDPDLSVRQCAALALRKRPSPQAIPDLIECLEEKDHLLVRLAADALVTIGSEAVPALLEIMDHGSQASRLGAVRALAMIGDYSTISALCAVLDDGSALVEYWASEGLERMGVGMVFFNPGG